ncbi:hypothetical protein A9P82_08550 [Arachidicoccus ginsenosidimutans]|uniref:hypothetical protein n=1 Tax=Arachidicoccus sp. BS20 TaxID=1850526 RepID=UPI0007F10B13|nr:hypothetical protein [Arachidicoccus sp. BS20]ANI89337.1 hypothetical protein A9P82_08550 [Arachidicoccus sp. BS20]
MGWTIVLEDEKKSKIESLNTEFFLNSFEDDIINNDDFKLVKYLNPYGDTIFNNLQMKDLITDLKILSNRGFGSKLLIDNLILLAKRCMEESHLYLVFYGD